MQTAYTYDNSSISNPSAWLTFLANTWNYKNAQGQWQQSSLVQNAYTFDNSGQRLTNQITSGGSSRTEQYDYDELNRLKTVDYGDGQTQAYSFDAMGNRLQKQDSASGTENYSYNAANMLLTRGTNNYVNDADGNTLTGGGRTNTWDSQNRLVQCVNGANNSIFVYGSDGIRHQSTVNGATTDFVLDNSMFVRERNHATGVNVATYLAGARGPEYRRDETTGQVRWYIYDGLGSVLGEVDPNGNITSSRKYDVYGLVRGGNNAAGTSNHKFVGQFGHSSEDNTGLTYMRARYYDPAVGRFASEDFAKADANWFLYCDDNPVNRVDASGKDWEQLLEKDLDAFGGFLLTTGLGLIGAGFAQSRVGAKLRRDGITEEGMGDALASGGLLSRLVGLIEQVDGRLKQAQGGTIMLGGFRKCLAGALLIEASQIILYGDHDMAVNAVNWASSILGGQ